jgi:hypothetical protein
MAKLTNSIFQFFSGKIRRYQLDNKDKYTQNISKCGKTANKIIPIRGYK